MDAVDFAIRYHDETKHHLRRYARGPGYLDWANQPDPFRRFAGAPTFLLPLIETDTSPPFPQVYTDAVPPQPVRMETVAAFLECALGISAWKEYGGSRWALRCNPSSGNLHPTEGYLIAGPAPGLDADAGVFHYAPAIHALEKRTVITADVWAALAKPLPSEAFFVALSSVHWREAWKYGERAYRYCQHDVGHALAALAYSAAALGWRVRLIEGLGDDDLARLLGLDRDADYGDAEREHPDLLTAVCPTHADLDPPPELLASAIQAVAAGPWFGRANRLSRHRATWELIDAAADACRKPPGAVQRAAPATQSEPGRQTPGPYTGTCAQASPILQGEKPRTTWQTIRQRRSAVAMDGKTSISRETFYGILSRTMPAGANMLWSVLGPPVCIHLLLFVHRVDGLAPGLYVLARDPARTDALRKAMNASFQWSSPPGCPDGLPLFLLQQADCREAAGIVSCGQEIAADGAFSLGMAAEFSDRLRQFGAWFYRRLFWETGMIGQALYLEAEAAGVRATGIGCFFDDAVHDVFGLHGHSVQSLYHFTIGGAVDDARLTTHPPYDERRRGAPTGYGPPEGLPRAQP